MGLGYDPENIPTPVTVNDEYLRAILVEQRLARKHLSTLANEAAKTNTLLVQLIDTLAASNTSNDKSIKRGKAT